MAGTKAGGQKAAQTCYQRYTADFYVTIGRLGGENGHNGGFATDKVGKDGLTGRERARIVGALGGRTSRRLASADRD